MPNIKIDSKKLSTLSQADREKITNILRQSKLMKPEDNLVPDDSGVTAPSATKQGLCKALCDAAQAVAENACQQLDSPAKEVCVIAAREAGDACRDACDSQS